MKQIYLKGQPNPVTLVTVEQDDEKAVIGTTDTGKRFVAPRANIAPEPEEVPAGRHPYRVYTGPNDPLRVVDPPFAEAEEWFLGDVDESCKFLREDGVPVQLTRGEVLSILSAMPEDERAAIAAAN